MRILAVTGGIASGKSTVTGMLEALGAPTLSADTLARDLLRPGTQTTLAVLAAFPDCAAPGQADAVDRRALGHLIFADSGARARLEALTHPAIIHALRQTADKWREQPGGCAALEIPLLFETGLETIADSVIVAACTTQQQITRLQARGSESEAEARRQINVQWPLEEKKKRAASVIDTSGSLEETQRQVAALWKDICR